EIQSLRDITPDLRSRRQETLETEARNKPERYQSHLCNNASAPLPRSLARRSAHVTKYLLGAQSMVHDEGERYSKHSTRLRPGFPSLYSTYVMAGGTDHQLEAEREQAYDSSGRDEIDLMLLPVQTKQLWPTGQDVIGYVSKETMGGELYSNAKDMAMFNPPRELGAGILD
ncbi:hypothetical protein THAOC_05871, partial [Thalassiosira oceanica]